MFRVAQRCRLGIDLMFLLADIGGLQDAQAFGVCGHDAVLDAVMDHLDKVTGAIGAAMQVTLFGGPTNFFASRRARYLVAHARSQPSEDWIEVLDHRVLTADHHAIPSLEAPDAAAGSHIDVV